MRAIYVTAAGGPDVLEERDAPDPVPGTDEVAVHVSNAGVNYTRVRPAARRVVPTPSR